MGLTVTVSVSTSLEYEGVSVGGSSLVFRRFMWCPVGFGLLRKWAEVPGSYRTRTPVVPTDTEMILVHS